jgi:hypothetical protein
VDPGFEHQTLRVYQQVPLATFDLLGAVVTTLLPAHACGLDRLAIHDGRAGLRVPLEAHTHALAQGGVHPFPRSIQAPGAEVMVDGLPRRELVGQQTPGTSATHDVEDCVKKLTQGTYSGPPSGYGGRQVRLYALPLFVGEVGWVSLSHAC